MWHRWISGANWLGENGIEERQIYFAEYPEGDYAAINATESWAEFEVYDTIDRKSGRARFTRDESIEAARAILKHFGETDA